MAITREQRRESPLAWSLRTGLLVALAVLLIIGAAVLGFTVAHEPDLGRDFDPDRIAVLFLAAPLAAAAYLVFNNLQSAQASHPLGEAFLFAPLPRVRFGLLRTLDSLAQPSSAFIVVFAFAPWFGASLGGAGWLNPAGLLSLCAYAAAILSLREALLAVHRYVLDITHGIGAAVFRVAFFLVMLTIPLWAGLAAAYVGLGDFDPLAVPTRSWMNRIWTPAALAAASLLFISLAIWVRSRPQPRGFNLRRRFHRVRPRRTSVPAAETTPQVLAQRAVLPAMLRMMIVQATRQSLYRYSAGLLLVFSVISFIGSGAGTGFVVFAAFITPLSGMYNLYGADAHYYALWLGSGRRLDQWTLARQLFFLIYYLLFAAIGVVVVFAAGPLPLGLLPGVLPLPMQAPLVAMLIGPSVSRMVITSHNTEINQRKSTGRSGRSFLAPLFGAVTVIGVGAPGMGLAILGLWPLNWLVLAALVAAVVFVRPYTGHWTPRFRERLAIAFRD